MTKRLFQDVVFTTLIYVLLLFKLGYEYGGGDQGEVLPFALYLNDNSLFEKDIYIQAARLVWPNERFFIVSLFRIFPENLWYGWGLLLHALLSVSTFIGLKHLASLFVKNHLLQWLTVFANLYFLYLYAPGANELYYNCLIASAAVVAVWSIYFFFKERYLFAFAILIPCTWLHPLVGTQLAAMFVLTYLFQHYKSFESIKVLLKPLLLYTLLGASYVLYLKLKTDAVQQSSNLSDQDFYSLLFDFRNPHHFNPLTFPFKAYLVTGLLTSVSLFFFRKNKPVFLFILSGLLLFVIGSINSIWIKNISIASLQFFKVSIWLKFIGLVGLIALIEKYASINKNSFSIKYEAAFTISLLVIFSSFYFQSNNFKNHFDRPGNYTKNRQIDICMKAQQFTPKDALFIHPVQFTKFHFYSKRSSFVNFKVMARNKNYIETWIQRLSLVYDINANMPEKGFNIQAKANANFTNIDFAKTQLLKEKGITHMITFKTHEIENLEVLAENEQYRIYKL